MQLSTYMANFVFQQVDKYIGKYQQENSSLSDLLSLACAMYTCLIQKWVSRSRGKMPWPIPNTKLQNHKINSLQPRSSTVQRNFFQRTLQKTLHTKIDRPPNTVFIREKHEFNVYINNFSIKLCTYSRKGIAIRVSLRFIYHYKSSIDHIALSKKYSELLQTYSGNSSCTDFFRQFLQSLCTTQVKLYDTATLH